MSQPKSVLIARLTGSPYRLAVSSGGNRFVLQEQREGRWRMVTWANDGFAFFHQIYRSVKDLDDCYGLQSLAARFPDDPAAALEQVRSTGPIRARRQACPAPDAPKVRRGRRA